MLQMGEIYTKNHNLVLAHKSEQIQNEIAFLKEDRKLNKLLLSWVNNVKLENKFGCILKQDIGEKGTV